MQLKVDFKNPAINLLIFLELFRCCMHRVRTLGLALMSPLKSIPNRRLASIASSLVASQPRELLGTLSLGKLSVPIYEVDSVEERARLVHLNQEELLDLQDPVIADHLNWMTQKLLVSPPSPPARLSLIAGDARQLGQDIFLFGAPGPFARILAATFAKMLNRTVETVVLHRDVGENELKQGRELREGGVMEFVDSAAVRAAKMGSILVLEGIERAERGVLPILNNLLENREMVAEYPPSRRFATRLTSSPRRISRMVLSSSRPNAMH